MAQIPLLKLGTLLVRTLAKPIAKRIKDYAQCKYYDWALFLIGLAVLCNEACYSQVALASLATLLTQLMSASKVPAWASEMPQTGL